MTNTQTKEKLLQIQGRTAVIFIRSDNGAMTKTIL